MPDSNNFIRLFLASSSAGKLREYRALATSASAPIELEIIPDFARIPEFEETAPTFAENAAGKALHYSKFSDECVIADDSGLVVPVLGGAPGAYSARYAGANASDEDRINKLLGEMRGREAQDRRAHFVCVIALAKGGQIRGIFSAAAHGELLKEPRGTGGFGYDPIFYFPEMRKTYAELSAGEKNLHSHRGTAFRRAAEFLISESS